MDPKHSVIKGLPCISVNVPYNLVITFCFHYSVFQIYRDFDLRCFLYANPVMTNLVQYDFEPILEVKVCCSVFHILLIIWAASWQNQQNDLCTQRRLRSAWASTQSDQSLCCLHEESLGL